MVGLRLLLLPLQNRGGAEMICSICKCEADFTRYMCIAKDGHRWTWGYLCEECALDRKQTTLAEGACIPPPAPPPSRTVEEMLADIAWAGSTLVCLKTMLEDIEDYIIHRGRDERD